MKRFVYIAGAMGFVTGVLWFVAMRFVLYKSTATHYHANFALYVDGTQDTFDNFTFYEEVNACADDQDGNPKHRVHMHENVNNLVHVHAPGVTWGHFFANLGYTLGNSVLKTDDGVFTTTKENKLQFVLNGKEESDIANRAIKSEDTLLVNYGSEQSDELQNRYSKITHSAGESNKKHDPASCSGGEKITFWSRLQKAAGFN
jgi:hypothetical protein